MNTNNENIISFKKFDCYGSNIILERGLRIGDTLKIMPCEGQLIKIKLNRIRYEICSTKEHKCTVDGYKIFLPDLGQKGFRYELFIFEKNIKDSGGINSRYALRSISRMPFRINHSFSYESIVERGDVLDIGYNRIQISPLLEKEGDYIHLEENHALLENKKLLVSDLNILLEGETGTGKTDLARRIHDKSGRRGNFVHVNLSSFSENLIESELFGHVKGAFTGAIHSKRGAFMQANYGTLFLDEIDSLSLPLQTKLLLTLDSKIIRPVGGEESIIPDVRLIFASGSKLENLVQQGKIRCDFFYRVSSGYRSELLPLRVKKEYIETICNWFMMKEDVLICHKLMKFYLDCPWSGNIRQLLGHLQRKKILTKGRKLFYDNIDEQLVFAPLLYKLKSNHEQVIKLSDFRKQYLKHVYELYGQNLEVSSRVLGISRNTLRSGLDKVTNYAAMIV